MRGPLRRLAGWTTAAAAVLPLCLAVGCQTVEEVEGAPFDENSGTGDFSDPAAPEAAYELDSQMCWDSAEDAPSSENAEAVWAACMRAKGWTPRD